MVTMTIPSPRAQHIPWSGKVWGSGTYLRYQRPERLDLIVCLVIHGSKTVRAPPAPPTRRPLIPIPPPIATRPMLPTTIPNTRAPRQAAAKMSCTTTGRRRNDFQSHRSIASSPRHISERVLRMVPAFVSRLTLPEAPRWVYPNLDTPLAARDVACPPVGASSHPLGPPAPGRARARLLTSD